MTYFRFKTIDPRYLMGLNAPTKEIAWQQLCMIGNRKLIEINRVLYFKLPPKSKNRGNIRINFLANRL